ncbi:hypothetical protein LA345_38645 (plasmid) [Burkholderia vietnamiensis]|uniref:DUF4158 domain-containing protein n=1 Tax=Burkholderia vietnamiensis (strain G4 / LMG 22486) TaxID=269482 RepID=A4JV66_BURVG|nr:hypothetical protein Bcep1808_7292 [Burkholderia vietnamiensis G4]MCB4349720.1 hypothetical protein [Burkholderia vietnamiensis]
MEHWQVTYLGIRQIPRELTEFELVTFFTFSARERALIDARRGNLYRLAVALHIGPGGRSNSPGCGHFKFPHLTTAG